MKGGRGWKEGRRERRKGKEEGKRKRASEVWEMLHTRLSKKIFLYYRTS